VQDTLQKVEGLTGIERRSVKILMHKKLKQIGNQTTLYIKEDEPQSVVERSKKKKTLVESSENIKEQNDSILISTQDSA
ncbi:hypothetical protein, partial [Bacillus thuringiensis]|uniref:hypothetical protein n=1 Tax=Bacillus thuringiensis TaxID=1428 RepID=UPI0028528746